MSDSTAEPHPAASLPPCRKCRSVTWEHTEGCWWGEQRRGLLLALRR